ncbi:MAG: hypothetical protein AAF035_01285 [Pseudomonadota bacterium]
MPDQNEELERQRIAESRALTEKYRAETEYVRTQERFYPIVISTGLAAAVVAFVKLVL